MEDNESLGGYPTGINVNIDGNLDIRPMKKYRHNGYLVKHVYYRVLVRSLNGKALDLMLQPDDTISDIKYAIFSKEGIPPEQQRLTFQGKNLADGRSIFDYNIGNGSVIYLVLAMKGGGVVF